MKPVYPECATTGKLRYTRTQAEKIRRRMRDEDQRAREHLSVYACRCGGWHVGNDNLVKGTRERKRRQTAGPAVRVRPGRLQRRTG